MNNKSLEWMPPESDGSMATLLPMATKEGSRRAVQLATIFAVIALGALAIGMLIPKKYVSSTTILVEESNIIEPLMEGRAVPTGVAARAAMARQVAFSRKIMNEILKTGGWLANNPTPVEKDEIIERIISRTHFSNPRENLIEISYADSDPQRSFEVTKRFAELIIQESLATKEKESRDAYEFIDSQVQLYHRKLTEAEANLEKYRKSNPDARAGIQADVGNRIAELRGQVEDARMGLVDLRSRQTALQAQLSGENRIAIVQTRTGQLLARLAELETEQQGLLLSFTENHPDVVRVQHQINDLQEQLRQEKSLEAANVGASELPGPATYNPLYAELRSKLAETRSMAAATESRIALGERLLGEELERARRIAGAESTLAELTRDYEVNRDLYQDLLKRRENARVSMNLDASRRGLSFRIQEPAMVPVRPSGLRLAHVATAGLGVAALLPLLLLFGLVKLDPRVRVASQIERQSSLPVLGSVPRHRSAPQRARLGRRWALAIGLVLIVPVVYGTVLIIKLVN